MTHPISSPIPLAAVRTPLFYEKFSPALEGIILDYLPLSDLRAVTSQRPDYKEAVDMRLQKIAHEGFNKIVEVGSYQTHFNYRTQHHNWKAPREFLGFFRFIWNNAMSPEERTACWNAATQAGNIPLYCEMKDSYNIGDQAQKLLEAYRASQMEFFNHCIENDFPVYDPMGRDGCYGLRRDDYYENTRQAFVSLRSLFRAAASKQDLKTMQMLKERNLCMLSSSHPTKESRACLFSFLKECSSDEIESFPPVVEEHLQGYFNHAISKQDVETMDLMLDKKLAGALFHPTSQDHLSPECPLATTVPLVAAVATGDLDIVSSILRIFSLRKEGVIIGRDIIEQRGVVGCTSVRKPNFEDVNKQINSALSCAFQTAVQKEKWACAVHLVGWNQAQSHQIRITAETVHAICMAAPSQETSTLLQKVQNVISSGSIKKVK